MTVALPLSAGRMIRLSLLYRSFNARLSLEGRLEGGGLAVRSILAMSCLVSSALSFGRWDIESSTWEIIVSTGMVLGEMAKLKPLAKPWRAGSLRGKSEKLWTTLLGSGVEEKLGFCLEMSCASLFFCVMVFCSAMCWALSLDSRSKVSQSIG